MPPPGPPPKGVVGKTYRELQAYYYPTFTLGFPYLYIQFKYTPAGLSSPIHPFIPSIHPSPCLPGFPYSCQLITLLMKM